MRQYINNNELLYSENQIVSLINRGKLPLSNIAIQTQRICDASVAMSYTNFRYVKREFQTTEMCKNVIQTDTGYLRYVKNQTEELIEFAKNRYLFDIGLIHKEFLTKDICKWALTNNKCRIVSIPEHMIDEDLCWIAIQNSVAQFCNFDKKHQNYRMCEYVVQKSGHLIKYVREDLISTELAMIAIRGDSRALEYVPKKYQTMDMCLISVEKIGSNLKYVLIDQDDYLCGKAIDSDPLAIRFVVDQTEELCMKAIKLAINSCVYIKNPSNTIIDYVANLRPEMLRFFETLDEEFYIEMIKKNPTIISHLPHDKQTEKMCILALSLDTSLIDFISADFIKNTTKSLVSIVEKTVFENSEQIIILGSLLDYLSKTYERTIVVPNMELLKDMPEGRYIVGKDNNFDIIEKQKVNTIDEGWLYNGVRESIVLKKVCNYKICGNSNQYQKFYSDI